MNPRTMIALIEATDSKVLIDIGYKIRHLMLNQHDEKLKVVQACYAPYSMKDRFPVFTINQFGAVVLVDSDSDGLWSFDTEAKEDVEMEL